MEQRDDWRLTEEVRHEVGRGDPFAAAVRATRMPMVITDPSQHDNPIVFANEAFQKLTGYGRDEILGRNCRFLQGPETNREDVARLRAALEAGRSIDVDLLNYRKDGTSFWNALYISPVRNDDGHRSFYFASQMDVTGRVEAQATIAAQKAEVERLVQARTAALEQALEAKTLLLHEVDHRVKNNLTMIGALLRLQARTISDPAVTERLEAMLERVDALATVHRRLYQTDDITRFDVGAFTANLVSDIVGASGRQNVSLVMDVEALEIPSAHASALGLVLNEIVTNAMKHAFSDGRGGTLTVGARREGQSGLISIKDDGPGMDPAKTRGQSLGQTLIARLSAQAGADVDYGTLDGGLAVTLRFPVESTGRRDQASGPS